MFFFVFFTLVSFLTIYTNITLRWKCTPFTYSILYYERGKSNIGHVIYSSRKPPQRSHQLSFSTTDQLTLFNRTNLIMENKLASSRLIGLPRVCVPPRVFIPFYLTSFLKFVSNRCLKQISFRLDRHVCQIFLHHGMPRCFMGLRSTHF